MTSKSEVYPSVADENATCNSYLSSLPVKEDEACGEDARYDLSPAIASVELFHQRIVSEAAFGQVFARNLEDLSGNTRNLSDALQNGISEGFCMSAFRLEYHGDRRHHCTTSRICPGIDESFTGLSRAYALHRPI